MSALNFDSSEIVFKEGRTIFEEGDESDSVYLLTDGEVEILRQDQGVFHHLGILDRGNLLGETSALHKSTRSATARAKTTVRAISIDADTFRRSFTDPLVKHVLMTISGRLRERYVPKRDLVKNSELITRVRKEKRQRHDGIPIISGVTPLVIDKLLSDVRVTEFPFVIGNTRTQGQMAVLTNQSLMIPLPTAPDLDSRHFEFIKRGRDIVIRDLGSKNGTVVNGETISKYGKKSEMLLEAGENTIGTGGMRSKVTFLASLTPIE
ncbi:cyclic nucleotide-binding domain-containing protein [Kordiimonas sp. SCSIO 12610]|uniref:cyclic nucleotide-binding domain-containing protein n=1 Tax=Kordiimonas sp. SCSIO 12610 TaxID=2829597 RepID=UPI0021092026|nr:cyclic nucleotide-binding domain-containing protein [Kordiimonas sp. SCSIO 12610]UTW56662.1 cyclic nucleotide-binding domain-containing protein [Kordiimonas sp. SCSIO 12610]